MTNGIIDLFSRRSPEIKETFKQSPCWTQHNDSWFLIIEHLQDLLLHIFVFFFFKSITTLPREAVTNCTLGLASATKKKHLAYVHKYTFSFQLWPKMHPVSNTMTTESKKIFTSVFLLSRCFLFIIMHLSSSTNPLSAQITATALVPIKLHSTFHRTVSLSQQIRWTLLCGQTRKQRHWFCSAVSSCLVFKTYARAARLHLYFSGTLPQIPRKKGLKFSKKVHASKKEVECFTHCNMLVKRLTRCSAWDKRTKKQESNRRRNAMCFLLCLKKDYFMWRKQTKHWR